MIRARTSRSLACILALGLGLWAVFLGAADRAQARASQWSFEVLEVIRIDRYESLIRLRPDPPGSEFPRSCETFVIHSFYDLSEWSNAGRKLAPRSGHERSVQLLVQAQITHSIVRIQSLGRGFGAESESSVCEVTSRALSVAPDPAGAPVIFSLYEEPNRAY